MLVGRLDREGFYVSWGGPDGDLFLRPGTVLSLVADRLVWGSQAAGFHATNLLLHLAACMLVMAIGRHVFELAGLGKPGLISFLGACLFAVLPSHSEAVCWISGRTDLLATVLGLGATLVFMRGGTLAALPLWLAGVLCKESILLLPVIWIVISRPGGKRMCPAALTGLLLAPAVYMAGRFITSPEMLDTLTTGGQLASPGWNPLENLVRALVRTFLPPLPAGAEGVMEGLPPALMALPLLAAAVLAFLLPVRRRPSRALTGVALALSAFWLVALLPAIRMKVAVFDTQSERFLYFPGVALVMLSVLAVTTAAGEGRMASAILSIAVALGFVSTLHLARNWSEAGRLCESIAGDLSGSDLATTVLVNVPDNLNGAYVFRNGLDEAVAMAGGGFRVMSTHSISSPDDHIDVRVSGDSVRITIPGGERFCSVEGVPQTGRDGGTVMLPVPAGADRILYYSSGSVRDLRATDH